MSHSHHSSAPGLPALTDFPTYYWATVGTAIGIAAVVNAFNHGLYRQRLSLAKTGEPTPAKPKSWLFIGIAALYALVREASNFSIHIPIKDRTWRLPTVGRTSLVLANFVVLIVLCFYGFDPNDRWTRESIAFRCGHVALGQIPLIFLLSGKNNIIGYLTGVSHERLNWLHRWCARGLLLTATLHMGYLFADWAPYDYIGIQLRTNQIAQRGMIAWAMLLWIAISSMTPIRGWCYEVFVLQHLVSFAVFIGFVYLHIPSELRVYIWIPVGLFWFDRTIRVLRLLYANIALFHPKQRNAGQMSGLWACKAEFTPLPHDTTRIVISNPTISWAPGQHVFLSCHSLIPLQSHPFTIASIPKDGKMEFLVKSESGGTRHFFRHAEKTHGLPASSGSCTKTVTIEGPYGSLRPLRQFDSVVLLAGSTGATFTFPLLRDIVEGWKENVNPGRDTKSLLEPQFGAVTRHVRFVWVVKSRGQLGWLADQLSNAYSEFEILQESLRNIKLELTIYVTCDDSFTEEHNTLLSSITATNPKIPQQHGTVENRSRPPSTEEKWRLTESKAGVEEVPNITSLAANKETRACGSNGECCCKSEVDEGKSPDNIAPCCCCAPKESSKDSIRSQSHRSSTQSMAPKQKTLIHPSILVFSGRPKSRDIIRRSLEQALGESAVVVCGPRGLVADVKQDMCSLSDERAVHKGTGAQGIYLHTESFGY